MFKHLLPSIFIIFESEILKDNMRKYLLFIVAAFSALSAGAFEQRNWLQQQSDISRLKNELVATEKWVQYPKYSDRQGWNRLMDDASSFYIKRGESRLNYKWQVLTASMYLEFERSGNRKVMENPFFENAYALSDLFMAEMAEGKGRFIPALIDGIFFYCDASSWVLSAHVKQQKTKRSLPDYRLQVVDLGSCQISEMMAWIYYFLHEEIDKTDPSIMARLKYEIDRRTLTPYMEKDSWWMAMNSKPKTLVNNWNPWCNAAVLQCFLLLEKDKDRLAQAVYRTMVSVDQFINHANGDGGCDEGTSYWGHAAGKLLDYLQLLNISTAGKISLFDRPMIRNLGEYISRSYIGEGWTVNFADASARSGSDPYVIYRYGKIVGSEEMRHFARVIYGGQPKTGMDVFRVLNALQIRKELSQETPGVSKAPCTWYPETQVCYFRGRNGLFLAAKAGFNNESHNHNDVGTFILYNNFVPVFIDAGVGVYTRQTFNKNERYKIWTMQSEYHNLPLVNGCGQKFGGEYKAKNVSLNVSKNVFSLDMAGAYPKEANCRKWVRTYAFKDAKVEITDDYQLAALNDSCGNELHFLVWSRPDLNGKGRIIVSEGKEKMVLRYDSNRFDASFEEIEIKDSHLGVAWRDKVHRILLKDKATKLKNKYTITIEKL